MTAYNPDHARNLLMAIAGCDYATASQLTILIPDLDMTKEEAITHVQWLCDLGYLKGNPLNSALKHTPMDFFGLRLTGQGALFLETFRDQSFYAQTKQKAIELGCGQMPNVLLRIGERLIENLPL